MTKKTKWHRFDYDDKDATAPPAHETVWVFETFYYDGVTTGWFDGYTFQTTETGDDCCVTHWAKMKCPAPPKEDE